MAGVLANLGCTSSLTAHALLLPAPRSMHGFCQPHTARLACLQPLKAYCAADMQADPIRLPAEYERCVEELRTRGAKAALIMATHEARGRAGRAC